MSATTECIVVGGGPAGMVTALILARGGVRVSVLEKHGDFLRDFRGDTVHPSTLELLDELGLFEKFDALPHSTVHELVLTRRSGKPVTLGDISRLKLPFPYIAIAPQWDFLNLLADAGREEPGFQLLMKAEFVELIRTGNRVAGVRYRREDGSEEELYADLTIAADGRWSRVREQAGLPLREFPVTVDLWWFRLDVDGPVGESVLPRSGNGRMFVIIPRKGYVQIGMIIPKGADPRLRAEGIAGLRAAVVAAVPELAGSADRLTFDDVKLLDVRLNRLRRWYLDGLLCLGDAAHAMSPVGGVGVNLAVQDGVAAATLLAQPLKDHSLTTRDLAAVQRRRDRPTRFTQNLQRLMHRAIGPAATNGTGLVAPGWLAGPLTIFPSLTKIPARAVAVGLRPEHAPDFARRASTRTR